MKIGTTELIIVLVVVIIIFGPTQIPKLTKMFGKSVRELRSALTGSEDEDNKEADKPAVTVSETDAHDDREE